jgi:trans-aconitate 2-methyltransferase
MESMTGANMTQEWNANLYDDRHAFVYKAAGDLVDLLNPQPGERVLDLGCGTGHLTAEIAKRGASVIGLDSSQEMLDQAAQAHPTIEFVHGDATGFGVDQPYDAVFSNAVLHWVRPPESAAQCIARALKTGGRFVAEFGGAGNVAGIIEAMRGGLSRLGRTFPNDAWQTWYFPTIGEYSRVLEKAGFEVRFMQLFDRPTPLEGSEGLRNWLQMFAGGFLKHVAPQQMERFLHEVEVKARANLFKNGAWVADYRRLRVVAIRMKDRGWR